MRRGGIWACSGVVALTAALVSTASGTAPPARSGLAGSFREAAARYRVPERLLLAAGYVNTRLRMPGRPAQDGGVGIMHLAPPEIGGLASRVGTTRAALRHDARANVLAGAAFLAAERPRSSGLAAWYAPLARLGGAVYADEVYDVLRRGFAVTVGGETVAIPATKVALVSRSVASRGRADYPSARWFPASPSNYTRADRPRSNRIRMIVIHVTEGSYGGSIQWFANPRAQASAHYVVRSSDGQITQTVREKDIAWHAGNSAVNARSIGIEHEAFESNCGWYTDAMYRSSAQLAAYLVEKYGIPIDRRHIIGHSEVPDPNGHGYGGASHHTDPGPCWKWKKYISLVRSYAHVSFSITPQRIADDARRSSFHAPRGWRRKESPKGYGRSFAVSRPSSHGSPARFRLPIPRAGDYALYAWWPAARSRNSSVPVGIDTAHGREWTRLDERVGSGWRYIGSFPLRGKRVKVVFSRRTKTRGTIAADAVKVELLPVRRIARPLTEQEGWTLTKQGLLHTADGGATWQPTSPPGVAPSAIRGIHMSGTAAWVVAAAAGRTPLTLFRTGDAGLTWSLSPLPVSRGVDVAAPVDLQVLDDSHLTLGIRLEPNRRSFSRGMVLRTSDGGTTWSALPLPAAGRVLFPTISDGWLVTGLSGERLYSTHNRGKSWVPVAPRVRVPALASTAYDLPTFWSATEGVIPLSIAAGDRSKLVFATTSNRGRSWKPARAIRLRRKLAVGATVPTAIADPLTWYAAVRRKLVLVGDGGTTQKTVGPLPGPAYSLQFASASVGWAQVGSCRPLKCSLRLLATHDGGLTWARLHLP
jgi:N-acetyl-anhydromuramyl-L-alanine amidase AmpD/photosystem II stability/assembly factor-like uncharacterized protein